MRAEEAETVAGVMAGAVGVGTLVLALFPFAIPFLALTAVAVAPLALLGLVPLLLAVPLVGAAVAIRAGVRRVRGRERRGELRVARAGR